MCGIVGVAGKIGKAERDAFRQLLIVDSVRGSDSTGFFAINGDETHVFKSVGDPYYAMESKLFEQTLLKAGNVLVGHNRYATTGRVVRRNAHPFDFEHVVGVHNGTLKNKWALPDGHTFDVDSEALYHGFNTSSPEEIIPKVEGAWSLVFWDKAKKELCFLRNDQRPMTYCLSEDKKTMFFASEGMMLHWILSRCGIKFTEIKSTAVDHIYRLPMKKETELAATALGGFSIQTLKGKPEVFPVAPLNGVRSNVGGAAPNAYQSMAVHLNKKVSFYTEAEIYVDGVTYVQGELATEQASIPVLIGVYNNPNLAATLMDTEVLTFTGQSIGIRYIDGEGHIVINPSSVVVEGVLGKKPESRVLSLNRHEFPGYEGVKLTAIEWRSRTEVGCAKCGDYPLPADAPLLLWESDKSFLCKHCHH